MNKNKNRFLAFIAVCAILVIAAAMTSCTDVTIAHYQALGKPHKIEVLKCDGTVARTYHTSGKVANPEGSDGYMFMNDSTGQLTEVSGNVIVTTLR